MKPHRSGSGKTGMRTRGLGTRQQDRLTAPLLHSAHDVAVAAARAQGVSSVRVLVWVEQLIRQEPRDRRVLRAFSVKELLVLEVVLSHLETEMLAVLAISRLDIYEGSNAFRV